MGACTLCPIPLVVDPRLGPARDESFCVCEADFFLYPSVVLTIALDEISTAGVKFDSANQRVAVRGYIGNVLGKNSRSVGLQSGLPYKEPFEKVELLTYGSYAGGFRAIFQILPINANASSAQDLLALFDTPDKLKAPFVDNNNKQKNLWAEKLNPTLSGASIKKNCEACPLGGKCHFGIVGETDMQPYQVFGDRRELMLVFGVASPHPPWVENFIL